MPRYVVFLRAINVGGRFVKMNVLAEHFRALGYSDVRTFINSGNVVFRSETRKAGVLAVKIQEGLAPRLGYMSDAFVRTEADVHAIAKRAQELVGRKPLAMEVNVAFLGAPLDPAQQVELKALQTKNDSFVAEGCEVYWLCRVKQSESKFSNAVFERKLKTRTTFRRATMLQGLSALLLAPGNDRVHPLVYRL